MPLFGLFKGALCACAVFRISLYWAPGYNWQEKDYEFEEFCWERNYRHKFNLCFNANNPEKPDKLSWCIQDAIYITKCSNKEKNQKWTFVELNNGEFLIKVPDEEQCVERISNKQVRLRECDSSKDHQRWFVPAGTSEDEKFALSQQTRPFQKCLGNHHHPKAGELLLMDDCKTAAKMDTLYWERN